MAAGSDPPQLERSLGLWQLVTTGVGIVVGAGIYVLIGTASADAGGLIWLSFVIAGVLALLTAFSYAELASSFPAAGAEFEFARQAFNDFVGFIAGWLMIGALIVAAAAVAVGFGGYTRWFIDIDARYAAAALLLVAGSLVAAGIERSMLLSVVLVVLQVGGLVLVIAVGVPHLSANTLSEGHGPGGVMSAAALVFFAFIGFDEVITLSEETSNPRRTVPRALLLSLGISTALYIAVGVCAVSVVGAERLGASEQPLGLVLEETLGTQGGGMVALIAIASTVNTTLLALTAATRIIFDMARDGALPPRLSALKAEGASPVFAASAAVLVAIPFAFSGSIELIAQVTNFAVYALFVLVNLAVVRLRLRYGRAEGIFHAPLEWRGIPLTAIAGVLASGFLLLYVPRAAWFWGLAMLATGVVAWLVSPHLGRGALAPKAPPPAP